MRKINNIIYITLLLILALGACKTGKNYVRPAVDMPAAFNSTSPSDSSSIADIEWGKFFTDTALLGLIDKGIRYNYNLNIALKRIDIARQQLKQAGLMILPQLDLQINGQYNRFSKNSLNGLSAGNIAGGNHIETYSSALSLSWEIDVWGKIRRQKEAVLAEYLQTYEASKAVQTQLVSDIAQGYYNLLMLDKQLEIVHQNLRLNDSTVRLTQLLKDAGEVNLLAVQQADAERQTTALLIPLLEQNISIQENVLQVLTGQLPGPLTRRNSVKQMELPVSLPVGFPAMIISRRPDIRADEQALRAANARVGAAQGNMYPSLTITAAAGLESIKASSWFSVPDALFGLAGGTVLQPIFRRRSLKTRYEISRVEREQAVLQFRQSVLNAVGEISNALVQTGKLKQQREIATGQVNTLRQAVRNSQLLFKSDLANYLEVITAQRNVLQAELDLASLDRQQSGAVIELYRSLGGGWK